MTTINEIKSAEWSLSVAAFGDVVEGFADINQCIQMILSTAKGSDPLRPEFGSDIWKYLDYGIDTAVPSMVREILDALGTWESRIQITDVAYEVGEKNVAFNILWILKGNKQKGSSQVALSLVSERDVPAPAPVITPIESPATLTADYVALEGVLSWAYEAPQGVTFQILRALGEGSFEQVGSVVGETTYTDTGLAFDSIYKYRVRAVKGSRVSGFSNEAELQTLAPILELASSSPAYLSIAKTGTAAVIESDGGISKIYVVDSDPENITAFYADDAGDAELNAGITGTLDLSGLSGLRNVRARNQSFDFVPGTWVRNSLVDINVSNSITTASRVTALIDAVILANGGTTTDDGSNYTGVPGETHASRVLNIGSIELDLGDPSNTILFEKVVALGTVGWTVSTVTTVCLKYFDVDTAGATNASAELEKTRELAGITYESGTVLDLSLYDTIANAQAGTSTGRLAAGYALTDAWLRNNTNYNAWVAGTKKALRFYSADNVGVNNRSLVAYKAAPTADRPCGAITEVSGSFIAGNAKVYDGISDYDQIIGWSQMERTQAWAMNINAKLNVNANIRAIFEQGDSNADRGIIVYLLANDTLRIEIAHSITNRIVCTFGSIAETYKSIIVTYSGNSNASGLNVYVDGVARTRTIVQNNLTNTIISAGNTAEIGGRAPGSTLPFSGLIRQLEIINRVATAGEITTTASASSFQAASVANADYLLAIDTNKTDGQPLTTRAGTPTYTITAFGGATYTPYLP